MSETTVRWFRKKPVAIRAHCFGGGETGWEALMRWLEALGLEGEDSDGTTDDNAMHMDGDDLIIETLEGDHRADPGDWIICGVAGEMYPCKSEIFDATYEGISPLDVPKEATK